MKTNTNTHTFRSCRIVLFKNTSGWPLVPFPHVLPMFPAVEVIKLQGVVVHVQSHYCFSDIHCQYQILIIDFIRNLCNQDLLEKVEVLSNATVKEHLFNKRFFKNSMKIYFNKEKASIFNESKVVSF